MAFLGFIGRALMPYALKLLLWGAIAAAVAAVLLGARNAGKNAERVAGMRRQLDNVKERNRVERETGRLGPDAVHERLRKWQRD